MGLEVKNPFIAITEEARPYLRIQKGSISQNQFNQAAWDEAYRLSLFEDFAGIYPYLPQTCDWILDIGGGMGGIDIMLSRNWWPSPQITIVDGMNDPPQMRLHRETFSNARVAHAFHAANGIENTRFLGPAMLGRGQEWKFDLILSLGAWCFHIEPKVYLDAVLRACRPGTVLILDVRMDKPKWRGELGEHFDRVDRILAKSKFDRLVFHAR